jgi:hypothetical protein
LSVVVSTTTAKACESLVRLVLIPAKLLTTL